MDFTTDKIRSLVRKWQSLIEAHVDVKTTDGYVLRMFCIGFTKKRTGHTSKTCYAQVRSSAGRPSRAWTRAFARACVRRQRDPATVRRRVRRSRSARRWWTS